MMVLPRVMSVNLFVLYPDECQINHTGERNDLSLASLAEETGVLCNASANKLFQQELNFTRNSLLGYFILSTCVLLCQFNCAFSVIFSLHLELKFQKVLTQGSKQ